MLRNAAINTVEDRARLHWYIGTDGRAHAPPGPAGPRAALTHAPREAPRGDGPAGSGENEKARHHQCTRIRTLFKN